MPADPAASPSPPLADLAALGWPTARVAAALAVAAPNHLRIAQAAAQLTLDDHVHGFAPWCDAQARATTAIKPR